MTKKYSFSLSVWACVFVPYLAHCEQKPWRSRAMAQTDTDSMASTNVPRSGRRYKYTLYRSIDWCLAVSGWMYRCQLRSSHVAQPQKLRSVMRLILMPSRLTQLLLSPLCCPAGAPAWSSELREFRFRSELAGQPNALSLSPFQPNDYWRPSLLVLLWNPKPLTSRAHCLQLWSAAPAFSRDRRLPSTPKKKKKASFCWLQGSVPAADTSQIFKSIGYSNLVAMVVQAPWPPRGAYTKGGVASQANTESNHFSHDAIICSTGDLQGPFLRP